MVTAVLFGLFELLMVGVGFLAVLVTGAIVVSRTRQVSRVERTVSPPQTQVGVQVSVAVAVPAQLGGAFGVERIPNEIGRDIRLKIGTRKRSNALYSFSPKMRGIYRIGPMELIHTDAFGAFQRVTSSTETSELVVYPAFDEIATLPGGVQRLGEVAHSPRLGRGDEFYSLRNYLIGDDLRTVHWKSSMRHGKMLVRQNEFLGEPKCVVVLDNCAAKHSGTGGAKTSEPSPVASFEAAVSAAASVCDLSRRLRMRLRLLSADGPLITSRRATDRELLRALAGIQLSSKKSLIDVIPEFGSMAGTVLILITPGLSDAERAALIAIASSATGGAVVLVDSKAFEDATKSLKAPTDVLGLVAIHLKPKTNFRGAWETGVKRRSLVRR